MRVSMPAIIDQAGRKFNADEADGVSRRHRLDQLRRRMPDLILCDLRMPGMDGLEFARRVRAQSRYRRARLIALTALDPWESALKTWSVGFDAHLTKPVTVETLAALNRFLAPPRARQTFLRHTEPGPRRAWTSRS